MKTCHQEPSSKCRRKVSVDFPSEARGWVALHQSGLSADQRAVVTARAGGELKFNVVASTLRSQAHDSSALRIALNARPRAERDFLPGDFVTYWRTQKYEKGNRLVGGSWYGTAIVIGKVGRKLLIYDRKNMFKVSLQHLRHATLEERAVAQSDGREMLGIAQYVREQGNLTGSHYVDLTSQDKPPEPSDAPIADQVPADAPSDSVHVAPSSSAVAPVSSSNAETPEAVSNMPSQPPSGAALISAEHPKAFVRSEPFHDGSHYSGVNKNLTYGPTRYRNSTKGPEVVRPPKLLASDFMEAHHEVTSHKRQSSRELSTEPLTKAGRTDITAGDEALLIEHQAAEAEEIFLVIEEQGESAEVFLANFLKKKMQTELHHSNNPHELQEAIDQAKTTECLTLHDEKQAHTLQSKFARSSQVASCPADL